MLQCYVATLFNVLCNNVITTGSRECVYLHTQKLAKTEEIVLVYQMDGGVWRVGFRRVSARTLPESRQKHRFLQRPRAIWRAPVGTVEQLLLWIRIEAEQQRERDLTRRSAARRIFMHFLRGS